MPNWREIHEEMTARLKKIHPDKEIFWARNTEENIGAKRMLDKYEVLQLTAQDAKKLGMDADGNTVEGSQAKVGDLIAMTRPKEMLEKEQKELKEYNDKRAKERDKENRNDLRKAGVKDL